MVQKDDTTLVDVVITVSSDAPPEAIALPSIDEHEGDTDEWIAVVPPAAAPEGPAPKEPR